MGNLDDAFDIEKAKAMMEDTEGWVVQYYEDGWQTVEAYHTYAEAEELAEGLFEDGDDVRIVNNGETHLEKYH